MRPSRHFRLPSFLQRLLDWVGAHELPVLVALLLMALALWGFVEIAGEVTEGDTTSFDEWMLTALRDPTDPRRPIGPRWLGEVMRDLTALGGVAVLTLLTVTICGYLWLRRMYSAMAFLLASVIGGLVISTLLKSLYDRPRPNIVEHLSAVHTSSFPSGHSMLAATVYLTIGALLGRFIPEVRFKAYFLGIGLALTGLVGVSRVFYGGALSDRRGGWLGRGAHLGDSVLARGTATPAERSRRAR